MKKILFAALGLMLLCATNVMSVYYSRAIVNQNKYSVMGVDVACFQGEIDWNVLEEQGVQFAFIKATEGSGHTDSYSAANLENAAKTNIYCSAYHFFSFDSAGETQAENYIAAVGKDSIDLPPVIDIEYYGDKSKNPPTQEEMNKILPVLLEKLEDYYGKKPIIYTTLSVYNRYIREDFSDYPLWIRNVYCEPDFIDWTFWQYSDIGLLRGYNGEEEHIDLNVYNGSLEELKKEFSLK